MNRRRMWAGLAILALLAGLEGAGPGLTAGRDAAPAEGARNLWWCLWGARLHAAGAGGVELLEISGAVVMALNCL